jgi:hypothetical protein
METDFVKLVGRVWPEELFKDVSLLGQYPNYGFGLNLVTVKFNWRQPSTMEVWLFDAETGKRTDATFFTPTTKIELLKMLRHHCGNKLINEQLNNFSIKTQPATH